MFSISLRIPSISAASPPIRCLIDAICSFPFPTTRALQSFRFLLNSSIFEGCTTWGQTAWRGTILKKNRFPINFSTFEGCTWWGQGQHGLKGNDLEGSFFRSTSAPFRDALSGVRGTMAEAELNKGDDFKTLPTCILRSAISLFTIGIPPPP